MFLLTLQHAQEVDVEVQAAAGRLQAVDSQFIVLQAALNVIAVSKHSNLLPLLLLAV
jgi:hypothetical protein